MYSDDFKRLALRIYKTNGSLAKSARLLGCGRTTIYRWARAGMDSRPRFRHFKTWSTRVRSKVEGLLQSNGAVTLEHIQRCLNNDGIAISKSSVRAIVKRCGYTYKRAKVRGLSHKADPSKEQSFLEASSSCANRLRISLDECYFSERIVPLYGYSPVGQPFVISHPASWKQRTLLMAVSSDGDRWFDVIDGACNRGAFESFITRLPCPEGAVLIMDNVAFHKGCTSVNAKGYVPLFTPPYMPVYNPIELLFSKVKNAYRRSYTSGDGVRSRIVAAIAAVTEGDIISSFRHVDGIVASKHT